MSQLRSGEPLFPGRKPKFGHHRWVISAISARDRAHINVEVCSSIRVIKYLYKYIYKGT